MAILIGIWELVLVLVIGVLLTALVLWWYWRQRLADLHKVSARQHQLEVYDLIREFKHQALHCLRPIKDNLYLVKKKMQVQTVTDATEWPQSLEDSIQIIEKYEWRLTRLIENMAFTSRLEAPDLTLRFSEVKLDVIVSDVASDFQELAEAKGARLTWWAKPEKFPRMMANEESLRQLFINLIDNAIQCCGKKDTIDIALEASEEKGALYVRVSDSGPGIPEEDWGHIFCKGYTVEQARGRKPKEGSQGLGLYIARLVVEKHKGKIDVASELGKGTTFSIILPIQRV